MDPENKERLTLIVQAAVAFPGGPLTNVKRAEDIAAQIVAEEIDAIGPNPDSEALSQATVRTLRRVAFRCFPLPKKL